MRYYYFEVSFGEEKYANAQETAERLGERYGGYYVSDLSTKEMRKANIIWQLKQRDDWKALKSPMIFHLIEGVRIDDTTVEFGPFLDEHFNVPHT